MRGLLSNKDYLVELIALTDTHVNKDLDYGNLFEIQGFDFVSKPRQNGSGGGGGVGIYIQGHLIWKSRSDLAKDEIEKAKSFYIFVMY